MSKQELNLFSDLPEVFHSRITSPNRMRDLKCKDMACSLYYSYKLLLIEVPSILLILRVEPQATHTLAIATFLALDQ